MGYKVNDMVNTGGVPMYILKELKKQVEINWFIETGTAAGDSIKEASKYFKNCITIELVANRQVIDTSFENITWYEGNSVDVLPQIVQQIMDAKATAAKTVDEYEYCVFWLDAHYSEPEPNKTEQKECCIIEELEIISPLEKEAIILIDDARLFLGQPPYPNNPKDWASIQEIFSVLLSKYPNNYSTVIDDFIVSIPDRIREPLDSHWQKNYNVRYPDAQTKLKSQTKAVWEAFKNYVQ